MDKKRPDKVFVQANTRFEGKIWSRRKIAVMQFYNNGSNIMSGETVELLEYDATPEGLIRSWNDRFDGESYIYQALEELWEKEKPYFGWFGSFRARWSLRFDPLQTRFDFGSAGAFWWRFHKYAWFPQECQIMYSI